MNDIKSLKKYYLMTEDEKVKEIIKESINEEEKNKKRKSRHIEIELIEEYYIENQRISLIDEINIKEEIKRIQIVLKRCSLTKEEKKIINKYYYEDKAIKEIAKEIGKSLTYVYKKKKQIIEKLKEEIRLSFPFEYKEEVMLKNKKIFKF